MYKQLQLGRPEFNISHFVDMYRIAIDENRNNDAELIIKILTEISHGKNLSKFFNDATQWQDIKEQSAQAIGKMIAYTALKELEKTDQ